ncbi:MAG: hypothetical protein QOF51_1216 [Chloroflexota bacterium]|nr:hypothetical protein [Chloroflexota bacterium]
MHDTAVAIRLDVPDATIVTGGVLYPDGGYLVNAMTYLQSLESTGSLWTHIGVHDYRGPADLLSDLEDINGALPAEIQPRTLWLTEFGDFRECADEQCLDPDGSKAQGEALESLYDALEPRLGNTPTSLVDTTFWFCHQSFVHTGPDPVTHSARQLNFGLTDWDRDTGKMQPSYRWQSWMKLQSRIPLRPVT